MSRRRFLLSDGGAQLLMSGRYPFIKYKAQVCPYLTKMRYQEIRAFFVARKTIYHIKGGTINEQLQTVRQALPQAGLKRLKQAVSSIHLVLSLNHCKSVPGLIH